MTVAPFGEVKKQVGLETEEAVPVEIENEVKEPESAVSAGSEDITEEDTALEDDVKEQENASDAGNNQIKEESEAADGKKDLSEPDSENENEKADMDAFETDTSDANASDADTSGADTSDADTSDSENDSAQDEDSVQVSRSAHFSMFLTSAAMASPSDAKEEENENDENEKNKAIVVDEAEEDNFERILGDSYETVGIKNASAAAFVTSAMELGLTDVAVLSAVEVEEIPHWQISKSKKATNLDENFESQVTLSLPSAEEKLENDIVFVLDKSTSVQLENEALEMLKELQAQAKENGAKVKVGVVIFNKEAHKSDFMDLETQYDAMRIRNGVRHGMRLMSNARAIAPKVASTPSNPVMLMNAALRWMPNFSHPGMDRIMQATGRRNIGRYRLAAMRSCRQLHRQYTANSAGLIGDQNGAYRPSVVPSTGRKAMASNSQMTLRSCDVRNRRNDRYCGRP